MSTKAFTTIRMLNHLMVILLLLACLSLLLIRIIFNNYFDAENMLRISNLCMSNILLITMFINLIVPFFGACVIDSKLRVYMRIFLVYDVLAVTANVLLMVYVGRVYRGVFERHFSSAITQQQATKMYIETTYRCSDVADVPCIELFKGYLAGVQRHYLAALACITAIDVLMWLLVRTALGIDPEERRAPPPRMVRQRVGFSTGSLRNKRLVSADSSPSRSVVDVT